MKTNNKSWLALKFAIVLVAVSSLLTGCIIIPFPWFDHDHDHGGGGHHDHHGDQFNK